MTALATAPAATPPCVDQPDLFGPTSPKSYENRKQIAQAIALCGICPRRVWCLNRWMGFEPSTRREWVAGGFWFDDHGDPPWLIRCRKRPFIDGVAYRCTVRGPHDQHQLEPIPRETR
jgi:hypothetical protein